MKISPINLYNTSNAKFSKSVIRENDNVKNINDSNTNNVYFKNLVFEEKLGVLMLYSAIVALVSNILPPLIIPGIAGVFPLSEWVNDDSIGTDKLDIEDGKRRTLKGKRLIKYSDGKFFSDYEKFKTKRQKNGLYRVKAPSGNCYYFKIENDNAILVASKIDGKKYFVSGNDVIYKPSMEWIA